jgi:hypothetical protein
MPEMKLDVVDAAELAELLQFLSQWLARDRGRLGASLEEFVGHPPTTSASCARTWSGSSSCSAAATASPSLSLARLSKAFTMTSPRGPRARKVAASPPLIPVHAAQMQGPLRDLTREPSRGP